MGRVKAIAMCSSDARFAAGYSPEQYHADRNDGDRQKLLNNQKLVRVRIVKTGQCQWRLPTNGRSITKLQFFTSNRIILAGYATNGDILLWELINEIKYGTYNCQFFKIKKVYLGNRMSAKNRKKIIKACKRKGIPYVGVIISSDKFEMKGCNIQCENCQRAKQCK